MIFYYIAYWQQLVIGFLQVQQVIHIWEKEKTISSHLYYGPEWEDPLDPQSGSRNQSRRQRKATMEISNTDETFLNIIYMFDTHRKHYTFFRGKKSAVRWGIHPSYTRHEISSSIPLVILHLVTPTIFLSDQLYQNTDFLQYLILICVFLLEVQ